ARTPPSSRGHPVGRLVAGYRRSRCRVRRLTAADPPPTHGSGRVVVVRSDEERQVPGLSDAPRMYRVLKKVLPPVTDRYFRTRIEGLDEHVPEHEPAILACNHLSFIDSILLPVAVSRPVYYPGKADYWDSWRTRWFFQGTGVVPVQRGGSGSGDAALATGVEILKRGELLGIYPEGTHSPDSRLYRGKTGPVRMALEAGVPIIPCAVIGTD